MESDVKEGFCPHLFVRELTSGGESRVIIEGYVPEEENKSRRAFLFSSSLDRQKLSGALDDVSAIYHGDVNGNFSFAEFLLAVSRTKIACGEVVALGKDIDDDLTFLAEENAYNEAPAPYGLYVMEKVNPYEWDGVNVDDYIEREGMQNCIDMIAKSYQNLPVKAAIAPADSPTGSRLGNISIVPGETLSKRLRDELGYGTFHVKEADGTLADYMWITKPQLFDDPLSGSTERLSLSGSAVRVSEDGYTDVGLYFGGAGARQVYTVSAEGIFDPGLPDYLIAINAQSLISSASGFSLIANGNMAYINGEISDLTGDIINLKEQIEEDALRHYGRAYLANGAVVDLSDFELAMRGFARNNDGTVREMTDKEISDFESSDEYISAFSYAGSIIHSDFSEERDGCVLSSDIEI